MADKRAFLLRLPPELWAEIRRWAHDELRSVNGQIEYILRDAVRRRRSKTLDGETNGTTGHGERPREDTAPGPPP